MLFPAAAFPDPGCATTSRTYMSLSLKVLICKMVLDQVTCTGTSESGSPAPVLQKEALPSPCHLSSGPRHLLEKRGRKGEGGPRLSLLIATRGNRH